MSLPLRIAGYALAAAAIGYGVWWFLDNFERREVERYVGYRGEAARDPLLAARRYLQRLGLATETRESLLALEAPPPSDHALLVTSARLTLGAERRHELLDWAAGGGHLLLQARRLRTEDEDEGEEEQATDDDETPVAPAMDDPLLAELGIELRRDEDFLREASSRWWTNAILLPGAPELWVRMRADLVLIDHQGRADLEVFGSSGSLILSLAHGRGRVTVLADAAPFRNGRIGEHDHAELLYRLLRLPPATGGVWLVHGDDLDPLPVWLWEHARPAVLAAAALLLAWLGSRARRFGPVLPQPPPDRRRITEHIRAAGEFLWRHGGGKGLLAEVRRAVLHRALARHPELAALPEAERAARLADLLGLDRGRAAAALLPGPADGPGPEGFTERVQILQTIRKRL